jgi:hypothetical protein
MARDLLSGGIKPDRPHMSMPRSTYLLRVSEWALLACGTPGRLHLGMNDRFRKRRKYGKAAVGATGYVLAGVVMVGVIAVARPLLAVLKLSGTDAVQCQCWILALVGVWCLCSWKHFNGSLLHPYILLFCSAFAFHGSLAVLQILRLERYGVLDGRFSVETVADTLALVSICIASLHLGALLGMRAGWISSRTRGQGDYSVGTARLLAMGMFLVAAVPTIITLTKNVSLVHSQGYFALYQVEPATGLGAVHRVVGGFFVPALLYIVALSQKQRTWVTLALGAIAGFSLVTLYIGGRSPAAVVLVSTAWLVERRIRRIPRSALIAGAIGVLAVFALVRTIRTVPGSERLSLTVLRREFAAVEHPVVGALAEIGGTMHIVSYVLELVPAIRPFEGGGTYLRALSALFPNIGWQLHPAVAGGTPSQWLIETVDPFTAAAGGGLGFSFIAEAYLNFGWFGSPIVMLTLGLFWGMLCRWGDQPGDPLRLAMLAGAMAMSLTLVRNDSTGAFRGLVWYCFAPYIILRYLARGKAPGHRRTTSVPRARSVFQGTP